MAKQKNYKQIMALPHFNIS